MRANWKARLESFQKKTVAKEKKAVAAAKKQSRVTAELQERYDRLLKAHQKLKLRRKIAVGAAKSVAGRKSVICKRKARQLRQLTLKLQREVGGEVEVGVEREDIVASRECLARNAPAL